MTVATRVGWCPGALRPMQSGDGLLVRVKPHCATLTFDQAAGLADFAARCGNGQIDLTGRANLQIRGVSKATLAALQGGLDHLGLLDPDPEVEAVRNIMASPLAGLDPEACADIRPTVAALEARLASDPACRSLPSKWSMVVDDGGAFSLESVAADLRFVCRPDGSVLLGLGDACIALPAHRVADALSGVAAVVAQHRPARMRDLIESVGADALLAAAVSNRSGAEILSPVPHGPHAEQLAKRTCRSTHSRSSSSDTPPAAVLSAGFSHGLRAREPQAGSAQDEGREWSSVATRPDPRPPVAFDRLLGSSRLFCGVAPRFGSFRAEELAGLVDAARRAGARDLRLTPWRVLLVTTPVIARRRSRRGDPCGAGDVDRRASLAMTGPARTLEDDVAALGFITRAADPSLGIVACVGAPGCHRATVSTRADAARLAGMMAPGVAVRVHVSGCMKGCARPAASPWTLVGRDGRYDVVRDGMAGDPPVACGLSLQAAAAWVSGKPPVSAGPL